MAARKKVIPKAYDPLAWLAEEQTNKAETETHEGLSANQSDDLSSDSVGLTATADEPPPVNEKPLTAAAEDVSVMSQDSADPTENNVIELGAECSVRTIADIQARFQQHLNEHGELCLNPAALQKIDTAGLQLLHALRLHLKSQGKDLQWSQGSSVLEDAAKLLAVEDFGCGGDPADQGFGFF